MEKLAKAARSKLRVSIENMPYHIWSIPFTFPFYLLYDHIKGKELQKKGYPDYGQNDYM